MNNKYSQLDLVGRLVFVMLELSSFLAKGERRTEAHNATVIAALLNIVFVSNIMS